MPDGGDGKSMAQERPPPKGDPDQPYIRISKPAQQHSSLEFAMA
jgi:hypothetical protein